MDSAADLPSLGGVAPFGDLGLKACSRLPQAFRSVPRPSSPLGAKASTRCPCFPRPPPATTATPPRAACCGCTGTPARPAGAPHRPGQEQEEAIVPAGGGFQRQLTIPQSLVCPRRRPEAAPQRQAYPCHDVPAPDGRPRRRAERRRLADARRTHDAGRVDRSTAMPAQRAPHHHHLTMSKQHATWPPPQRTAAPWPNGVPFREAGPGPGHERSLHRPRPAKGAVFPWNASEQWWAWADLNGRPHAYQACALTS
jgi:hypothetical protein